MIWTYLVCLGGLIFASLLREGGGKWKAGPKSSSLRRSWTLCCWFPLILILPRLQALGGGTTAREIIQFTAFTEVVGWVWLMIILRSMKAALTSTEGSSMETCDQGKGSSGAEDQPTEVERQSGAAERDIWGKPKD